ncbi:MAG: hypothetical protein ABI910_10515 [Gemmatimonadota bacterium]
MWLTSRTALLLVALCSHAPMTVAQSTAAADSSKPHFSIGSTQTMLGYLRLDAAALQARFTSAGIPGSASGALTVGLGVDIRSGRILLGAGGQSILASSRSNATFRTRSSGNVGQLDLGVLALRTKRLSIYPLVGVGIAHVSVDIVARGDFAFDDGLAHPARQIGLSNRAPIWNAGILVEQRLQLGGRAYAVSVRAGIVRSAGAGRWESAESTVHDGPSGMRGSYARVGFSRPLRRRRDAALPLAATLAQTMLR